MSTKTIKVQKDLRREATIEMDGEGADRKFKMSISSDTPYKRYDWYADEEYWEVLGHGPGEMDDARLKAGLPILFNHDRDEQIALANSFSNDGYRCTVFDMAWSEGGFATEKKKDIDSGVLKFTSVGYQLMDDGECIGAKDGLPIYKFKWAPYEASVVTIPADYSVGVGRSRSKPDDSELREIHIRQQNAIDEQTKSDKSKKSTMKLTPGARRFFEAEKGGKSGATTEGEVVVEVDVVSERKNAIADFKARCKKINDFVAGLKAQPKWYEKALAIAEKHCSDEADYSKFHEEVLMAHPHARAIDTPNPEATIGMSRRERGRFSIRKAIYEIAMQNRGEGKGLTGIEKEAIEAAHKQYAGKDSREFSGLCIPDDILTARFDEDRDIGSREMQEIGRQVAQMRTLMATNFSAGGALIGTDLLAGSFIDILRNAVLIGQGPLSITELGGLVGNVAIPKQTGTITVYWLPEGGSVTEADQAFAQLFLTPHRMVANTAYTKQLLAQASLSIEAFVRSDTAMAMAVEEDRVTILGTGLNGEPLGIFNTTGVLSNVTFGGSAVFADFVNLEYGLENANVRNGQMAIITSPLTKSYLKQTLQIASPAFPIYLWMPAKGEFPNINGVMAGIVNEYPAYHTKNVTTNQVCQGVFSNIFKARWAGFDVVVDPYTGAKTETISLTTTQWLDVGLRYPQSFNVSTDAPTAPA